MKGDKAKGVEKQSLEINQLKNNLETQGSTMDIAFQERDRATIGKQDILAEVEELRGKLKEFESFTNETSRIKIIFTNKNNRQFF